MTKPKPPGVDPFLVKLSTLDRLHPLSIGLAMVYLGGKSRSTLEAWHGAGKPPPRRSLNGVPVYLAGDVQDYLANLPPAGKKDPAWLLEPPMRGGRRKKAWPTSFASMLARGDPDESWLFAMVPAPAGSGLLRPVDFIEALDLEPDDGVDVKAMTLAEYAETMLRWTQGVMLHERAETFAEKETPARGGGSTRRGSRRA
jgi:hypothetical protein